MYVTHDGMITLASFKVYVSRWITSWLPTQQSHSDHVSQNTWARPIIWIVIVVTLNLWLPACI